MYLRIRKLDPDELKPGDHVLMIAQHMGLGVKAITMKPGQLEWWDGLEWHKVKVVDKDADDKSPYS